MATGKISKNARRSGLMSQGEHKVVIENDTTRGKVFVEIRSKLEEGNVPFQNLSSSHPISISKGSFEQAAEIVKAALGDRYSVEKEEAGCLVMVENTPKTPARMVVRESPFSWYKAN